jgi:hypothetical protein
MGRDVLEQTHRRALASGAAQKAPDIDIDVDFEHESCEQFVQYMTNTAAAVSVSLATCDLRRCTRRSMISARHWGSASM